MKVKNIDSTLEKIDKTVLKSLNFLDNNNVYISIVFTLFLYNTCLFSNINNLVSDYYQYPVVKVVMLLLIIYVSRKSYLIGLLLAISYLISLNYKTILENFQSSIFPLPNSDDLNQAEDEEKSNDVINNTNNESFSNNENGENSDSKECTGNLAPINETPDCKSTINLPNSNYDSQGLSSIKSDPVANGYHSHSFGNV